jgi:hypothetical protein
MRRMIFSEIGPECPDLCVSFVDPRVDAGEGI